MISWSYYIHVLVHMTWILLFVTNAEVPSISKWHITPHTYSLWCIFHVHIIIFLKKLEEETLKVDFLFDIMATSDYDSLIPLQDHKRVHLAKLSVLQSTNYKLQPFLWLLFMFISLRASKTTHCILYSTVQIPWRQWSGETGTISWLQRASRCCTWGWLRSS